MITSSLLQNLRIAFIVVIEVCNRYPLILYLSMNTECCIQGIQTVIAEDVKVPVIQMNVPLSSKFEPCNLDQFVDITL